MICNFQLSKCHNLPMSWHYTAWFRRLRLGYEVWLWWWIPVPSCYPVEWRPMWEPTTKHQSYGCVSNLGFCPNHLETILKAGHHSILSKPNSQTHIQTLAPGWHEAVQTSPPDGRVTGQNWHRGKPICKGLYMICAYTNIYIFVRVLTTIKQVKISIYI